MTTLAAIHKDGVIALAADGRSINGLSLCSDTIRKMKGWPNGAVLAVCGNQVTTDILEWISPPAGRKELHDLLKAALDAEGFGRGDDEPGARGYGLGGIAILNGALCDVDSALSIAPVSEGWPVALGSGGDMAMGAMLAALKLNPEISARHLVLLGMRCAAQRDVGTGPFFMLALRGAETFGPEWIYCHS